MKRLHLSIQQFIYFIYDYKKMSGSKKYRMLYLWLSRVALGLFFYRFERAMYLLLGKGWTILRILFYPFFILVNIYSNLDISYKAEIGPGITILHPTMGVVISRYAKIGKNVSFVGGNIIGGKVNIKEEPFYIGDNVSLGANAVILGPCHISNNTIIGACALILKDTISNSVMAGVPAKQINITG